MKFGLTSIHPWTLVCVFIWDFVTTGIHSLSITYEKIYDGDLMFDETYTFTQSTNRISCGAICTQTPRCWMFTYDSQTKKCGICVEVKPVVSTVEASAPTLKTYLAKGINDKRIIRTPNSCNWLACKVICEDMGGHLFPLQDPYFGSLLCHVYTNCALHIGIFRHQGYPNVWYQMNGQIFDFSSSFLEWDKVEPNNKGGAEYFVMFINGYAADIYDAYDHTDFGYLFALCEV